ncbi:MAG: hypothetical protein DHS80DRAFT_24630 [Piptocephalis tieghemiana]|nr:MAG: hypothetical protein DHS80DRAFT_24630 [Piptocephalis tieghemiana]
MSWSTHLFLAALVLSAMGPVSLAFPASDNLPSASSLDQIAISGKDPRFSSIAQGHEDSTDNTSSQPSQSLQSTGFAVAMDPPGQEKPAQSDDIAPERASSSRQMTFSDPDFPSDKRKEGHSFEEDPFSAPEMDPRDKKEDPSTGSKKDPFDDFDMSMLEDKKESSTRSKKSSPDDFDLSMLDQKENPLHDSQDKGNPSDLDQGMPGASNQAMPMDNGKGGSTSSAPSMPGMNDMNLPGITGQGNNMPMLPMITPQGVQMVPMMMWMAAAAAAQNGMPNATTSTSSATAAPPAAPPTPQAPPAPVETWSYTNSSVPVKEPLPVEIYVRPHTNQTGMDRLMTEQDQARRLVDIINFMHLKGSIYTYRAKSVTGIVERHGPIAPYVIHTTKQVVRFAAPLFHKQTTRSALHFQRYVEKCMPDPSNEQGMRLLGDLNVPNMAKFHFDRYVIKVVCDDGHDTGNDLS